MNYIILVKQRFNNNDFVLNLFNEYVPPEKMSVYLSLCCFIILVK